MSWIDLSAGNISQKGFRISSRSVFCLTVCLLILQVCRAVDLSNCRHALGMQSGEIPDSALRASSSYDDSSVGPANGRIRIERNGGAWCPRPQVSKNVYEWMEIDLKELKVITQVETQGRFGNGQGQEFAEQYMLEYMRVDGGNWIKYRDRKGNELIPGNDNQFEAKSRNIVPPVIARKIRVVPYSVHPKTICMRVELYGCDWQVMMSGTSPEQQKSHKSPTAGKRSVYCIERALKDGILSYSMPQGERRGYDIDLYDVTYDGTVQDTYLSGGLGQLTDGIEGPTNFRLDPSDIGRKGYDWIGWKNDTADRPPVQIIFQFDRLRNFTSARFHCNNMFNRDVRVVRKVMLYFAATASGYQERPVVYHYTRDEIMENARYVIVQIPNRVGRYVKAELYFDAKWMMMSEVRFDSEIVVSDFIEGLIVPNTGGHPPYRPSHSRPTNDYTDTGDYDLNGPDLIAGGKAPGSTPAKPLNEQIIGIIIGAICMTLLLLMGVVCVCIMRRRSMRKKYAHCDSNMAERSHMNVPSNMPPSIDLGLRPGLDVPSGNKLLVNGLPYGDGLPYERWDESGRGTMDPADLYREPWDGIQLRKLPDPPAYPQDTAEYLSDTNTSTYAVPDMIPSRCYQTLGPTLGGDPPHPTFKSATLGGNMDPIPLSLANNLHPSVIFTGVDAIRLRGGCGNSTLVVPPDVERNVWVGDVLELSRESLELEEKLGKGPTGEIHLCEASLSRDALPQNTSTAVARIWNTNSSDSARASFSQEVMALRCLRDPNLARLMGVCSQDDPLCIVTEYPCLGDLKYFLQQHVAQESTIARQRGSNSLSYGCLIYLATQIASGMKYLETLNIAHRDLAARNCLVGAQCCVKVSDLAMSQHSHVTDYWRMDEQTLLPIRWMSWESILLGKFSPKSDVWAFAVTLWEILTFARSRPFQNLTDEQMVSNARHHYTADGQESILQQTPNCPKEIYDLMRECWNRDDLARPAFREIHMFLQRKNMGYSPDDESSLVLSSVNNSAVSRSENSVPFV